MSVRSHEPLWVAMRVLGIETGPTEPFLQPQTNLF